MTTVKIAYDRNRLARMFDEFARNNHSFRLEEERESPVMTMLVERSLASLKLQPDDVLLDVGTGPGLVAMKAAASCAQVIGIDISRVGLDLARKSCSRRNITNVMFVFGAAEDPSIELDLKRGDVNKILLLRVLHHLPDDLKRESLHRLAGIMKKPGRLVIGDQMPFESPVRHVKSWDDVCYDGGLTDQPAPPQFIADILRDLGMAVRVERVHPLAGVITADLL